MEEILKFFLNRQELHCKYSPNVVEQVEVYSGGCWPGLHEPHKVKRTQTINRRRSLTCVLPSAIVDWNLSVINVENSQYVLGRNGKFTLKFIFKLVCLHSL